MPIRVECLTCRKGYKAPDKAAGRIVTCPGCGGALKVPADAPAIAPAPKVPATSRPAAAQPSPAAAAAASEDDDDPFSILGLMGAASVGSSGDAAPRTAPRPPATPRGPTGSAAALGRDAGAALVAWAVGHPLVVAVSTMAAILLLVGVAKGGAYRELATAGGIAGGILACIGWIAPLGIVAKTTAAVGGAAPKRLWPKWFGGFWMVLIVLRTFGNAAARLEKQGEAITPEAVLVGVLPSAAVFIVLGGLYLAVRRFGLFRVLAPVYLFVTGIGVLLAMSAGPGRYGDGDGDLISPRVAIIGTAVAGASSSAGGVTRSEFTIPPDAAHGGPPLKLVVYRQDRETASTERASSPCVIIAPAGSNLLSGRDLGDGDHPEALPWAQAGYVVVQVALPGTFADPEGITTAEIKRTFADFSAARAGLGCIEQVLAYIKREIPQVDPRRIATVGHSSAGTLALLAAESNPEIKACVAFAPCTDVAGFHRSNFIFLDFIIPSVRQFCRDSSPINHVDRLQCPVFYFQAEDDPVTPLAGATRFVDAAKERRKLVDFVRVKAGGHYQSMIDEGIPRGIQWLDATFAKTTSRSTRAAR